MDEKTEELREIFVEVTDEETVTEQQEESPGSLTGEREPAERLGETVADMREHYEFETSLSDEELVTVVREFYGGTSDEDIAEELDVTPEEVFEARLDLHLVREEDTDAPFDLEDLRDLMLEEAPVDDIAEELDASESTVRRYGRVLETQSEARRAGNRFRIEFEEALAESDLSNRFTTDVKDDGLDEAIDGMETNVSF